MTEGRYSFSKDPWGQAAAVGVLTLIPARRYPAWLRRTMTWVPTLSVTAIAATPGASTAVLRRLGQWQGQNTKDVKLPEASPAVRAACAVSAGAVSYAGWRLAFWSDTAAETLMRKMRVPAPRAAMALAAAAATGWSIRRDNERAAAREKDAQ